MSVVPMVVETTGRGERAYDVYSMLLKEGHMHAYASVSTYPRVSEWLYIGDAAINLAQVAAIEFGGAGDGGAARAIVRLSSYTVEYEADGLGKTWFAVRDAATIRLLRAYVEGLRYAV